MADKKTQLSIILSAIDHATAPIKALNERLDHLTKPIREFKKQLGELAEKSGLSSVVEGFKGVGDAVKETLFKFLEIGVVVGEVVHLMFELVNQYEELGKKAERLGVGVDFLAGMRDAAERTGVPVEMLDESLETFSVNLAKARVGAGKMAKFLPKVSTNLHSDFGAVLLRQMTAAKGNAAAIDVLADAMEKLTDPSERAALALAALGDAKLAPLLVKGSKGIKELRDHYTGLAGSQEGAAKAAGEVHESMLDLKASTDGIKAALVEGLSPALKQLVEELQAFLTENHERIKEWAADLGKKLPGAIHTFVEGFLHAIDTISDFVDSIGGIKTVGIALAAFLAGPLILAIATFSMALLATPVGWFLAAIAGIALAVHELLTHLKEVKEWFLGDHFEGLKKMADNSKSPNVRHDVSVSDLFQEQQEQPDEDPQQAAKAKAAALIDDFRKSLPASQQQTQQSQLMQQTTIKVDVDFANAPKGMRVKTEPNSSTDIATTVGYATGWMP